MIFYKYYEVVDADGRMVVKTTDALEAAKAKPTGGEIYKIQTMKIILDDKTFVELKTGQRK